MITFGPYTAFMPVINNPAFIVLNVSSPIQAGYDIRYIYPPLTDNSQIAGPYAYDQYLAGYLMETREGFTGLMNIIYADYQGYDVLVLIDQAPWMEYLTESLIKFIQCRYGIEVNLINEFDDMPYRKPTCYTMEGRQLLQADKERFIYNNFDYFAKDIDDECL